MPPSQSTRRLKNNLHFFHPPRQQQSASPSIFDTPSIILHQYDDSSLELTLDEIFDQDPDFFDQHPDLLTYLFTYDSDDTSKLHDVHSLDQGSNTSTATGKPTVDAMSENFTFIEESTTIPHMSTSPSVELTGQHTSSSIDDHQSPASTSSLHPRHEYDNNDCYNHDDVHSDTENCDDGYSFGYSSPGDLSDNDQDDY